MKLECGACRPPRANQSFGEPALLPVTAVIGLGYVGLPLVVEFAKHGRTIGFDIHEGKVSACRAGTDPSRELTDAQMAEALHAEYTSNPAALAEADIIIVAVPTPVDQAHIPDNWCQVAPSLT